MQEYKGDGMLLRFSLAIMSFHLHIISTSFGRSMAESGRSELSWKERKRIASELAMAIAHLHSQGVVHRDLKPANVLLGEVSEERG